MRSCLFRRRGNKLLLLLSPDLSENGSSGRARRSRRGLSIFEVGLWATLFVFVIVGLITAFNNIIDNYRETQTSQLVQSLVASTRAIYINSIDYRGLSADVLVNAGDVSAQYVRMRSGIGNIISPEEKAITLSGWDGGFALGLETGRKGTCIAVISAFIGNPAITAARAVASITLPSSGTTANAANNLTRRQGGNQPVARINTACDTNQNVIIEFDLQ